MIMSLTANIACLVVEVAEAEIAVVFVDDSDAHITIFCGCDFLILLVEAYWRNSTTGKN